MVFAGEVQVGLQILNVKSISQLQHICPSCSWYSTGVVFKAGI